MISSLRSVILRERFPSSNNQIHRLRLSTRTIANVDIAIVGGGIIGSALACALAQSPTLSAYKIALIDTNQLSAQSSWTQHISNRVVSLTPKSVQFLKDINVFSSIPPTRMHAYDEMEVWDGVGNGKVSFTASEIHTPAIGYIVEIPVLKQAVIKAIPESVDVYESVKIETPIQLDTTELTDQYPLIKLSNGTCIHARLVVGADGFNSVIRKELVPDSHAFGRDYGAKALVATLQIESPDRNTTAWQRFLPTGPIAMLPVSDTVSSLVWSMDNTNDFNPDDFIHAKNILTDAVLAKLINAAFFYPYDEILLLLNLIKTFHSDSEVLEYLDWRDSIHEQGINHDMVRIPPFVLQVENRDCFPLRMQHVLQYTGHRSVLVGDACHTTHPLAGQGMNLGISDVACLTGVLSDGASYGADIGHSSVLQAYPRESFHIYDRHCECIYHANYYNQQLQQPTATIPASHHKLDTNELNQLIYGVIYSARNLVNKLRKEPVYNSDNAPFLAYSTSHYKLHYYETPSSLKFVLITSTNFDTGLIRNALRSIYRDVYCEHVVKNPLAVLTKGPSLVKQKKKSIPVTTVPAAYITNDSFASHLDKLIQALSSSPATTN